MSFGKFTTRLPLNKNNNVIWQKTRVASPHNGLSRRQGNYDTAPPTPAPVSQKKQGPSLSRFLNGPNSSSSTCYLYSPSLYHPKTEPMMWNIRLWERLKILYACQRRIFTFFGVQLGGVTSRQKLINELKTWTVSSIAWRILKEMGIPDHLTCLLRNLFADQKATVRIGSGTDWFQIGKGVCQGCILSPCLFNLYAEYIMRTAGLEEAQAGIKIAGKNTSK